MDGREIIVLNVFRYLAVITEVVRENLILVNVIKDGQVLCVKKPSALKDVT